MRLQFKIFFDESNEENKCRSVHLHIRKLSYSRFGDQRRQDQPRTKDIRVIVVWRVAKLDKPVAVCVEKLLDMSIEVRSHL